MQVLLDIFDSFLFSEHSQVGSTQPLFLELGLLLSLCFFSFLSAFDWLRSLWGEPSPNDVKNTVETQVRVFWNDTSDGFVVWLLLVV